MGKEDEYYKIIDRCAENEENFAIQNSATEHAAYLIKTLFKHAKEVVLIFTGNLHEDVYGRDELKEEAIAFLKKGPDKKLVIAYQKGTSETILQGSFLKAVTSVVDNEKTGKLEIWDACRTDGMLENHFAIMDNKAFRYELDGEKRNAIANFNDEKYANILKSVFERIVKVSKEVSYN